MKRIILLSIIAVLLNCFFTSAILADSGTCGTNLTWTLDGSVLTISGTGEMANYDGSPIPWGHDITMVIINTGVTSIGGYAFRGCSGLTSVSIPNSVTSIGDWAFDRCSSLTSITIPNSVTSIGVVAFSRCSSLTSITIPNSVTSIGNSVFNGCSSLTSITIPNSVTSIGNSAFYGCRGLTSLTIPNSVTSIGEEAFYGCSGLTSVTIPNSITSIGEKAFHQCTGLTMVNIDDISAWCRIDFTCEYSRSANPLTYAHHLYLNGNEITNLIIPNDANVKNCAFCGCSGLTSVTIPNSITSIGEEAFYGCSGLTSVTIPNSITSIGEEAFYGCSGLISVIFGSGLKEIQIGAFYGCDIQVMTCHSIRPPSIIEPSGWINGSFGDLPLSTIVYVPAESYNAYLMHNFWGKFDLRVIDNSALEDVFADNTLNELLTTPEAQIFTLQGNDITACRNNLPAGIYIVRLGNKSGKVAVQ